MAEHKPGFVNQPTIDDVKKFAGKVYIFCAVGGIAGIVLISSFWFRKTVMEIILWVTGILLTALAVIMLIFFLNFFRKVRKKMEAESARGDNHDV